MWKDKNTYRVIRQLLLVTVLFTVRSVFAQDPVFTQFYAVPVMTNPAFSGSMNNTRFGMGYRNQWMGSGNDLHTFYLAGDKYLELWNSGVGVTLIDQKESVSGYNMLLGTVTYAYHLQLGDRWSFFPGLSVGYGLKQYNFNDLIFGDQIDLGTGTINPGTSDPVNLYDKKGFFDFSAGGVIYGPDFWIGVSARHLTQPDISFAEQEASRLQMFFSVHTGYRWMIESFAFPEDSSVFFTASYMKQDVYNRLDFGVEAKMSAFSFGMLSALVLDKLDDSAGTLLTLSPVAGLEFKKFKLGISYDFPLSDYAVLKGTGEVTFQYFIKSKGRRRRMWQVKY